MEHLLPYYKKLPIRVRLQLKRTFRWFSKRAADPNEIHVGRDLSVPGVYAYWSIPYTTPPGPKKQAQLQGTELFVCGIKNVYVRMDSGVVRNAAGNLLADSAPLEQMRHAANLFDGFKEQAALRVSGKTYAIITCVDDSNYYHWLIDSLPQLLLLDSLQLEEPITLLMRADLKPFQQRSLEMCLPPNVTVQYVENRDWVSVDTLLLPSHLRLHLKNYIPIEYLNYVRTAIMKQIAAPDAPVAPERIYISRELATTRRVHNEAEVIACLSAYGFKAVQMEMLSFEEQVNLMRNANWIVSPHGAGLTNMLFADNASVLEFLYEPSRPLPVYYRSLASYLGHRYADLMVEKRRLGSEMYVDVKQLEQKLIEMGA